MQTAVRLIATLIAAAPALSIQPASAQTAQGQSPAATAAALPPPPYAAEERVAVQRGPGLDAPQPFDRYGGGGSHRLAPVAVAPVRSEAAYQGPRLAWSGKTESATVAVAPQPQAPFAARYAGPQPLVARAPSPQVQTRFLAPPPASFQPVASQPIAPQPRYPARTYAQAPQAQTPQPQPTQADSAPAGWRYIAPIGSRGQEPPLPASIYAPTPAATTAQTTSAAAPSTEVATTAPAGGRRYSVHREYGIQPDPIPLPPQFFGATADMSKPETDEPARRIVTADGKSHNALQPSDGQ